MNFGREKTTSSQRRARWKQAHQRLAGNTDDSDPLLGVVNLFDASMVLVVALLLALRGTLAEVAARMSQQDITIVTNPGKPDMEMIIKRGKHIEKLKASEETGRGQGQRLGAAYRLESGEIVYVPDSAETGAQE